MVCRERPLEHYSADGWQVSTRERTIEQRAFEKFAAERDLHQIDITVQILDGACLHSLLLACRYRCRAERFGTPRSAHVFKSLQ